MEKVPESVKVKSMNENIGHVITGDVNTADLIHGLHPCSQYHPSKDSRWPFAGQELSPGVCIHVFSIKDVFDDIELCFDGGRRNCGPVTFEDSEDFVSFVIPTLADEKTRGVRKKWAKTPNKSRED